MDIKFNVLHTKEIVFSRQEIFVKLKYICA